MVFRDIYMIDFNLNLPLFSFYLSFLICIRHYAQNGVSLNFTI